MASQECVSCPPTFGVGHERTNCDVCIYIAVAGGYSVTEAERSHSACCISRGTTAYLGLCIPKAA